MKSSPAKLASDAAYRARNREAIRARHVKHQAKYRSENPDKARMFVRVWAANNPGLRAAYVAASKMRSKRFAPWADKDLIGDIYEYAMIMRASGIQCDVDHIVPRNGRIVSGLHVESNLTVILSEHNRRKGSSFGDHQ